VTLGEINASNNISLKLLTNSTSNLAGFNSNLTNSTIFSNHSSMEISVDSDLLIRKVNLTSLWSAQVSGYVSHPCVVEASYPLEDSAWNNLTRLFNATLNVTSSGKNITVYMPSSSYSLIGAWEFGNSSHIINTSNLTGYLNLTLASSGLKWYFIRPETRAPNISVVNMTPANNSTWTFNWFTLTLH